MASSVTWAVTLANHCQVEVNIKRKLIVRRGCLFFIFRTTFKERGIFDKTTQLTCEVCACRKNLEGESKVGPAFICYIG